MNRVFRCGAMLFLGAVLLTGCTTRSISNSGYQNPRYRNMPRISELNELEVLGVWQKDGEVTEEAIRQAVEASGEISLKRHDSLVLIQSGAAFPDDPMVRAFGGKLQIIPLSGVPADLNKYAGAQEYRNSGAHSTLHRDLRLSAAKGGATTILVYWGILETGVVDHSTKAVSWLPIAGSIVPDETQTMRVQVKGAVIDVRTGAWKMFIAKGFEDQRLSASLNRVNADQSQVMLLKALAYKDLAEKVCNHFGI